MSGIEIDDMEKRRLAKAIVTHCFANTSLETVRAEGRLSDAEMRAIGREAVDRVYSTLRHLADPHFRRALVDGVEPASGKYRDPKPSRATENFAVRYCSANLGIVFEVVLGAMHPGTSTIIVCDQREVLQVSLEWPRTKEYVRGELQVRVAGVGNARRWRSPDNNVVLDLLLGGLAVYDPAWRRLEWEDGIGSLRSPSKATWRTGPGPAFALSTEQLTNAVSAFAVILSGNCLPLPAVIVVSRDGWVSASPLEEMGEADERSQVARAIESAAALDPRFICLLDVAPGMGRSEPVVSIVAPDREEVIDMGAAKRKSDAEISAMLGIPSNSRNTRSRPYLQLAKGRAFLDAARGLVT
jgi:hypothetical protein